MTTKIWLKLIVNRLWSLTSSTLLSAGGVFIRWNGMVEWNRGMVEYWDSGMTTPTERSCVPTITHSFVEHGEIDSQSEARIVQQSSQVRFGMASFRVLSGVNVKARD